MNSHIKRKKRGQNVIQVAQNQCIHGILEGTNHKNVHFKHLEREAENTSAHNEEFQY